MHLSWWQLPLFSQNLRVILGSSLSLTSHILPDPRSETNLFSPPPSSEHIQDPLCTHRPCVQSRLGTRPLLTTSITTTLFRMPVFLWELASRSASSLSALYLPPTACVLLLKSKSHHRTVCPRACSVFPPRYHDTTRSAPKHCHPDLT